MKEGMAYFTDTYLTQVGLIIFVGAFLAMAVLQLVNYKTADIRRIEKLPLESD